MVRINKEWFQSRWAYRVFALLAAIALWFYVVQIQNPTEERLLEVSVDYINLPANMAISDKVDTVKVRIQGSKNVVEDILPKDITASLDLSEANIGQFVGKINITLPERVQLVSVTPIDIAVEVQELVEVQRSVKVVTENIQMVEGYSMLTPSVYPEEVILSGSKDKIALVDRVYVTVEDRELSGNFEASMPVNVADKNGNSLNSWITVRPSNVDVLLPVVSDTPSKVAPISASITGEPAEGYMIRRIIIEPSVVTVLGSQEALDRISYVYTSPIDVSGTKNDVSVETSLISSEGIQLDNQEDIKVVVQIEQESSKVLDSVLINVVNKGNQLHYDLAETTATIRVSGPKTVIDELSNSTVTLEADVDGLGVGRHTVSLTASVPASVNVESIYPNEVSIVITAAE